ncbi:MAG: phosphoribosyltransferase family protein [Thermodesulfobacteriota bacterium]
MAPIIEDPDLRDREFVFADRQEAGTALGRLLAGRLAPGGVLLAIPSGGVPVARAMQAFLPWRLELLLVRKVQIPWNREAGFGAVDLEGNTVFNPTLLAALRLSDEMVAGQVRKALGSLRQRNDLFRGNRPFPDVTGRELVIVDDGLASGYTMLAAIAYVRRRSPASISVAVPTGLEESLQAAAAAADAVYCLNIRQAYPFAVASAYRNWHDLDDGEVLRLLAANNGASTAAD